MLTFLSDILYVVSHSLLIPDIIVLLLLIAYAIFSIGSILVELVTERRHFKVAMPTFLDELTAARETAILSVVEQSGLLRRQKTALLTVFEHRSLPGDALIALVRRLLNQEESRYDRIVARNNMAAKVAPMFGLVGTLVPLGPGIQALGQGDTAALSSSLLVAFDTTVAGLVAAAVCLIIAKIRQGWYDDYMSALDSSFATMVQKIEDMRALGILGEDGALAKEVARDENGALGAHDASKDARFSLDDPLAGIATAASSLRDGVAGSVLTPQAIYNSHTFGEEGGFGAAASSRYAQSANGAVAVAQPVAELVAEPVAQPTAQHAVAQSAAQSAAQSLPQEQAYMSSGMPLNPDYDAFFGTADSTQDASSNAASDNFSIR